MASARSAYLKQYASAASKSGGDYEDYKPSKKAKAKIIAPVKKTVGFVIKDEDASAWAMSNANSDDENEEDRPMIVSDLVDKEKEYREKFSRARNVGNDGSGWVTLEEPAPRSPPRRTADLSPPRKAAQDLSPPRRSHADLSPPRRPPPRDLSPPRRPGGSDLSPPRRPSGDLSPPRRPQSSERLRDRPTSDPDLSPPRKKPRVGESEGSFVAGSGLFTGSQVAEEEATLRKKQMETLRSMNPEAAGRDAQTVYRDKRGRILTMLNQVVNPGAVTEESQMEWGVGRVDKKAKEQEQMEEEAEVGRGYHGVTIDDERYNQRKREEIRWDDPMAALLRKSKPREESKRAWQESNKPVYRGYAPPNRFGIRPGHRWDGVDRSNGFEDQWFKAINQAHAESQADVMGSLADM